MELSELRAQIDTLDDRLLALFLERMQVSEQVAAFKNEHRLPILNRQREREILADVSAKAGNRARYARRLFSTLFELSRARQAELISAPTVVAERIRRGLAAGADVFPQVGSVACQGVEGAHSQAACDRLLPGGCIVYVRTFEDVASAVRSGLCEFGVLPIENSSSGSVRAVYDLLREQQLSIVRSARLWIRQELLALPGAELREITAIYSHEQAIGQCSRFLESLNGVRVIPCTNTAAAARLVAEGRDPHAAAIAAPACAALYGLTPLCTRIQNSENNYTRFLCITKEPRIYAGANRISLILSLENRPGVLHEVLAHIAALGINLTKLESCHVPGSDFEYCFFLDLEASVLDPAVFAMLEELERGCAGMSFLGCYAEDWR